MDSSRLGSLRSRLVFLLEKSPFRLLCCDNLLSFVFTETNRQVTSNLCQMGARLRKPFPGSSFEWEHVLV